MFGQLPTMYEWDDQICLKCCILQEYQWLIGGYVPRIFPTNHPSFHHKDVPKRQSSLVQLEVLCYKDFDMMPLQIKFVHGNECIKETATYFYFSTNMRMKIHKTWLIYFNLTLKPINSELWHSIDCTFSESLHAYKNYLPVHTRHIILPWVK